MSSDPDTSCENFSRNSEGQLEEVENILSEDTVDRCGGSGIDGEEMRRLLSRDDEDEKRQRQSTQAQDSRRQTSTPRTSSSDSMSNIKRDSASSHHSYHFRRKFANFRSDSVFSDVMPIASSSSTNQDPRKGSDPNDTVTGSSSLTSLKVKESKWVSLRKKLKITSSSGSASSNKSSTDTKESSITPLPLKSVFEKRSLFQRAKTLSILPIGKSSNKEPAEERQRKRHQHTIHEPKELFNVGGEMNMIPLEFLIDINDLKIGSK